MLHQDDNFYLKSLGILITCLQEKINCCLLEDVWILYVICKSLTGIKGLTTRMDYPANSH